MLSNASFAFMYAANFSNDDLSEIVNPESEIIFSSSQNGSSCIF